MNIYPSSKKYKLTNIKINDIKIKSIIKKIIENTLYVDFEYFYCLLIKNFKEIIKGLNENDFTYVYIYITDNHKHKDKNEIKYWIYNLIDNYIKHISFTHVDIKIINDLKKSYLNNGDIILLLNDCCCMERTVEEEIRIIKEMNNSYFLKLNIYLFIPFISLTSLSKIIMEFNNNKSLFNYSCFHLCPRVNFLNKTIEFYLKKKEIFDLEYYYNNRYDFSNLYLIYFDHNSYNIDINIYNCII
jgi:hypothetical protein